MPWRSGVVALRDEARARVPALVAPRRLPPLRVLHVGLVLGRATMPALIRKRRGTASSLEQRAALALDLRRAFERLGVTFIKLGQLIAGAEGLLPDDIVAAFATCRDQVPPEPFRHVRRVVEADLGAPLETVFAEFEETPIAAASIAQVHAARLQSGEDVVVKVQRPGLGGTIAADLASMAWLIHALERRAEQVKGINLTAYLELLAETLTEELDFRLEAQNMLDLAEVLAGTANHRVVVPRPHPELVTKRVLVMERLHGLKIEAASDLASVGADAGDILTALLVSFFEGSLVHGVFHGDMHGGNMLVTDCGTPALLDMGVTGRFAPSARPALVRLLMASDGTNREKLEAFQALGGFPSDVDLDEVEALIADVESKKQEANEEDMATATREFLSVVIRLGARIPKELFLFVRGILYLNGALAALGHDTDLPTAFGGVLVHLADQHGSQLAAEAGVDPERMRQDAADQGRKLREELGLGDDAERITFQHLKAARSTRTP
jgi:ubiquinone biosynthesis protein